MKIRIGGQAISGDEPASRLQNAFANVLIDEVKRRNDVAISENQLKKLAAITGAAAEMEAMRVFDVVRDIISSASRSVSNTFTFGEAQLMSGYKFGAYMPRGYSSGSITWHQLTTKYLSWKTENAPGYTNRWRQGKQRKLTSPRFFTLKGGLRTYLNRGAPNAFQQDSGGVQVHVNKDFFHDGPKPRMTVRYNTPGGKALSDVLASVEVAIFPNLSPYLLPMLSANRWNATDPEGELERDFIRSSKTASKLINPRGEIRPLVLPVVQFFMLNRIPGVVNKNLKDFMRGK